MNTFLIILAIVAIGAAFYLYNIITGKVKDTDGDFIPDVVEEKVKAVKKEVKEVKLAVKKVKKELTDIPDIVTKPRKKAKAEWTEIPEVSVKPKKKRGRPAGSKNKPKNTK